MRATRFLVILLAGLSGQISVGEDAPAVAPKPTEAQLRHFETHVRPLLIESCIQCHGPEKQRGKLRLDSRVAMLIGGGSGPAIVPGDPAKSLLISAIRYADDALQMPPDGKLSDKQIADLTIWVKEGAVFPAGADTPAPDLTEKVEPIETDLWSFQQVSDPLPPAVQRTDWIRSPLDQFILAKLEAKGLAPAVAADKRTLIRRATFDLTGLPPTPKDVADFLADDTPEAFAKVVDRLLSSPQYGERWGRHWLDVARYADSNGLDENVAHGNAWRYRDWVIDALNADKPYDEFLREQLAGDLLPTNDSAERHRRLIATGFLTLGPKVLAEVDESKMEMDIVDEQIDTVGRSLLGLTLGCARCHDHKFDPIGNQDYYALAGIFKSTRTMEHFRKVAKWHENSIATEEDLAAKTKFDADVSARKADIEKVVAEANAALQKASPDGKLPEKPESQYPEATRTQLKSLRDALAAFEKTAPELPTAMGVTEGTVENVAIHVRGSHLTLGKIVERQIPRALATGGFPEFPKDRSGRLIFADWLVRPENPLTSRVMVNRLWRWHFGQGIVASTDNFGELGELPTHPELLDWLATQFVKQGWSLKAMHRLIMLSSTYQMSSTFDEQAAEKDPENRLYWRSNVRRLEAEPLRDSLLAVGGILDTTMGGSLLHVKNRAYFFDHTSRDTTKYDSHRRAIYLPVVRNNLYDVFQLFDFADATVLNGNRSSTTVALQALFFMNSDLVNEACDAFADRTLQQATDSDARLRFAYETAYGRLPTDSEVTRQKALLKQLDESLPETDDARRERQSWSLLCQVLISANEFLYLR